MNAKATSDRRFVRFRALSWAVYLVVAVGFSCLVIYSVFSSVFAMTPERPETHVGLRLEPRACLAEFRRLAEELNRSRIDVVREGNPRTADQRFLVFRTEWLQKKREIEARCAIEESDRSQLEETSAALEHLLDLYTTGTIQFSSAIGPTVDKVNRLLEGK